MAWDSSEQLLMQLVDRVRNRYFGKYRGRVTDNLDPTERGRLKVTVPAVLGDLEVWAMPCVPYAGTGVGFYCLPEADTGVWVEFEAGDPSYAIWTGFFWADAELPDEPDAAIKIWKTEKLTVRLDDAADELKLEDSAGSRVTIAGDIVADSGGHTHTVGSAGVSAEVGGKKTELSEASFKVNGGALEVL